MPFWEYELIQEQLLVDVDEAASEAIICFFITLFLPEIRREHEGSGGIPSSAETLGDTGRGRGASMVNIGRQKMSMAVGSGSAIRPSISNLSLEARLQPLEEKFSL